MIDPVLPLPASDRVSRDGAERFDWRALRSCADRSRESPMACTRFEHATFFVEEKISKMFSFFGFSNCDLLSFLFTVNILLFALNVL